MKGKPAGYSGADRSSIIVDCKKKVAARVQGYPRYIPAVGKGKGAGLIADEVDNQRDSETSSHVQSLPNQFKDCDTTAYRR